jgi:hypothetical protein
MKAYLKYEMGKLAEDGKVVRMSFQPEVYISGKFETAIAYLEVYTVEEDPTVEYL